MMQRLLERISSHSSEVRRESELCDLGLNFHRISEVHYYRFHSREVTCFSLHCIDMDRSGVVDDVRPKGRHFIWMG
jgi:hypothetical protein